MLTLSTISLIRLMTSLQLVLTSALSVQHMIPAGKKKNGHGRKKAGTGTQIPGPLMQNGIRDAVVAISQTTMRLVIMAPPCFLNAKIPHTRICPSDQQRSCPCHNTTNTALSFCLETEGNSQHFEASDLCHFGSWMHTQYGLQEAC